MQSLNFHKGFGSERFAFGQNAQGDQFKVVEFPRQGGISALVLVFRCEDKLPVADVSDGNFPTVGEAVEHFGLVPA